MCIEEIPGGMGKLNALWQVYSRSEPGHAGGGTNGLALASCFGCCLVKSQQEYSCTSSWILSGVSFLNPGFSFGLIARQLGPHLETLDRTAVSWCIPTNFYGEIGLYFWWERVVSYGRRPIPPLLIRVSAVLILMATFAYQNCSFFPILFACLALMLVFIARDGGSTPLIKIICRDGSFPSPRIYP